MRVAQQYDQRETETSPEDVNQAIGGLAGIRVPPRTKDAAQFKGRYAK
jgi:hypothetical protein